jgi:hypothetical protein
MKTPSASTTKVSNSVTWVNVPDGKYNCIWDGLYCGIPMCGNENILFEVDGENFTGINTAVATVYAKMARVNRNNTEANSKANYDGSIDGNVLTVIDKEMVV